MGLYSEIENSRREARVGGARGEGCIWFWQGWVWDAFKICKRQMRMCICVIIFTYLWWIIVGFVMLSFIPYGQCWKLRKAIPMLTLPVNISPLQLMMEYAWLRWWEVTGKVEFGLWFNPWLWLWDAPDYKASHACWLPWDGLVSPHFLFWWHLSILNSIQICSGLVSQLGPWLL